MDTAVRSSVAPAFHSDDVENVADYRSLSVLAMISLLVGLLSSLCLLSNLFLGVALLGILLSLLALRRIALSEGRLAGRWMATAGLALCIVFSVATMSRSATVRYVRTSQAEEFGRGWLAVLAANDTSRAFKATVDGNRPPAPPEPGMPAPKTTPLEDFQKNPLVAKIAAAGQEAEIEYTGTDAYIAQSQRDFYLRQRFTVSPKTDSGTDGTAEPIEAVLTLQRSQFRGDPLPRWLVTRYETPDEAAAQKTGT